MPKRTEINGYMGFNAVARMDLSLELKMEITEEMRLACNKALAEVINRNSVNPYIGEPLLLLEVDFKEENQ
jgi:malic enzyme